jgi:hypothetical protein
LKLPGKEKVLPYGAAGIMRSIRGGASRASALYKESLRLSGQTAPDSYDIYPSNGLCL